MSNDFKKVSVIDDRLNTTDSLNYAVFRGGQNVTNVRMPAISANSNNLNFVIPFPSESTVLDREIYLKTTTRYFIDMSAPLQGNPMYGPAPGNNDQGAKGQRFLTGYQNPLLYASMLSVNSFPTHRTFDTVQVQINNDVQTINCADVIPALLRCADGQKWERTNMTASQPALLSSVIEEYYSTIGNTLGGYDLVQGNKNIPNGSFNCDFVPLINFPVNPNDPLSIFNYAQLEEDEIQASGATGTQYFCLTYTSVEPLLAPPFIWNETDSNRQGIYGIQNMSIVCNYSADVSAAIKFCNFPWNQFYIRSNGAAGLYQDTVGNYVPVADAVRNNGANLPSNIGITQQVLSAELQMKYITPHGNDIKPLRNVIPLLQYPRFISTTGTQVDAATSAYNQTINQIIYAPSKDYQLSSQTFTLNMIPDKLIIFVRPDSSIRDSEAWNDFAMVIKNITIQWNNHTGLLSNCSQEQLFHMSREAGSNQDWLQFSGITNMTFGRQAVNLGDVFRPIGTLYNTEGTTNPGNLVYADAGPPTYYAPYGYSGKVGTIGTYLMIDMGKHLELAEPWNAPGSLGSYQIQFNMTVFNQAAVSFTPEIIMIPVNSGIMVTEKGQTSSYTGILTKTDVLDAALQEPYSHMNIKRIVGRGHGDMGKALPKHVAPMSKTTVERMVGSGKPSNLPKEPKKEINNAERMASRLLPEVEITEDQLLED
jgi:hypothetical protein